MTTTKEHTGHTLRSQSQAKRKLRSLLLVFFVFLLLPFSVLLTRVYVQLDQQIYFQYREQAASLIERIDERFVEILKPEELRPVGDYRFFNVTQAPLLNTQEVSFSPLSKFPSQSKIPGLLGYFELTPDEKLRTPLLPDIAIEQPRLLGRSFGLEEGELQSRKESFQKVKAALRQAGFIKQRRTIAASSKSIANKSVSELKLNTDYFERDQKSAAVLAEAERSFGFSKKKDLKKSYRKRRKEKVSVPYNSAVGASPRDKPKQVATAPTSQAPSLYNAIDGMLRGGTLQKSAPAKEESFKAQVAEELADTSDLEQDSLKQAEPPEGKTNSASYETVDILTFEGSIDPFQFSILPDGKIVFFRKVWQERKRYIQGFVVDGARMLDELTKSEFYRDSISGESALIVAHKGKVYKTYQPMAFVSRFSAYSRTQEERVQVGSGEGNVLLYSASLSVPLEGVELLLTVSELPKSAGSILITGLAVSFLVILLLGSFFIYRLGMGQIELAQQRSDFVSAVSHELKTPLTSIRMYGEMLREGWIEDREKIKSYYDFIFFESERLSRLVNNVLQLARISNREFDLNLKKHRANQLLDVVRSKVSTQADAAEVDLEVIGEESTQTIEIDEDSFVQIVINLVDNAIKFSRDAEVKKVNVGWRLESHGGENWVQFYVRDFGAGIEKKQLRKIFKLFYRAENELTRNTTGTGIGLSLVKELTLAMNGRIDVSNRNPGAEFVVSFRCV